MAKMAAESALCFSSLHASCERGPEYVLFRGVTGELHVHALDLVALEKVVDDLSVEFADIDAHHGEDCRSSNTVPRALR